MRDFYRLADLAIKKNKSVDDLLWKASEGGLRLALYLESKHGCAKPGVYSDDTDQPTPDFLDKDRFWYRGFAYIHQSDIGRLLIGKTTFINRIISRDGREFTMMQPNIYLDGDRQVKDWTQHVLPSIPIEVGVEDLFVMAKDVEQFEKKFPRASGGASNQKKKVTGASYQVKHLAGIARYLEERGFPGITTQTVENWYGLNPLVYGKGDAKFIKIIHKDLPEGGKKASYWALNTDLDKYKPPPGKKQKTK